MAIGGSRHRTNNDTSAPAANVARNNSHAATSQDVPPAARVPSITRSRGSRKAPAPCVPGSSSTLTVPRIPGNNVLTINTAEVDRQRSSSAGARRGPKRPAPPPPGMTSATAAMLTPALRPRAHHPSVTTSVAIVEADVQQENIPEPGSPQQRAAAVRTRLNQLLARTANRRSILSEVQSVTAVDPIEAAIRSRNNDQTEDNTQGEAAASMSREQPVVIIGPGQLEARSPRLTPRGVQVTPPVITTDITSTTTITGDICDRVEVREAPMIPVRRIRIGAAVVPNLRDANPQDATVSNSTGVDRSGIPLDERLWLAGEELTAIRHDSTSDTNTGLQSRVENLETELQKIKQLMLDERAENRTSAAADEQQLAWKDEDEALCSICMERPKTHAFVPCGHVVCLDCSVALYFQQKENMGTDGQPPCSFCNEKMVLPPIKLHF